MLTKLPITDGLCWQLSAICSILHVLFNAMLADCQTVQHKLNFSHRTKQSNCSILLFNSMKHLFETEETNL